MEITAFFGGIVWGILIGYIFTILYATKQIKNLGDTWSNTCEIYKNTTEGWKVLYYDLKRLYDNEKVINEALIQGERDLFRQQEGSKKGPRSIN